MKTIFVEPEKGKNAYNCDARRWIKQITEVVKTPSITKMLNKKELKLSSKEEFEAQEEKISKEAERVAKAEKAKLAKEAKGLEDAENSKT